MVSAPTAKSRWRLRRLLLPLLIALAGVAVLGQDEEKPTTIPELDFGRGIHNTAKAKPAVASSATDNDVSTNATDGASTTAWRPKDEEFPHWVRINILREIDAKAIFIQWDTDEPVQYQIEASTDGIEWSDTLDATGNDKGALVVSHKVSTKSTQYFRLTITGSESGKSPSLHEIAIYEDLDAIPKAVQDAAKGILPKPKPDPEPEPVPEPEPKPDPEKMTQVEPKPEANPDPKTTTSHTVVSTKLVRPVSNDPLMRTLRIPDDHNATIFARPPEVTYPTSVKTTLEGAVYVSSDKNSIVGREKKRGKVQKLIDLDGDGVADEFHDFIPDVDSPRGLEWDGEWLYVMHPPHLSAYRDTDGDHVADENRRLVTGIGFGFEERPMDHNATGITLGIDGWLYLAIGDYGVFKATGDDGRELTQRGGCVVRVKPDGSGLHVFSRGLRQVSDVAVSPGLDVFARDTAVDDGKWGARFYHLTALLDAGYPSLFLNFPEDALPPLFEAQSGTSGGAVWLERQGQPASADMKKGMIYRHELEPDGGSFVEKAQHEFIGIPFPIAVDSGPSGDVFVTSWNGGTPKPSSENVGFIARVTPKKTDKIVVPDFKKEKPAALITHLASPHAGIQIRAQRELLRRDEVDIPALKKAALESTGSDRQTNPVGSFGAIFTIAQTDTDAAFSALIEIAGSPDIPVRTAAFRALGDRSKTTDHEVFKALPGVTDPVLIREMIVAMTRSKTRDTPLAQGILKQTMRSDPLVKLTSIEALVQLDAQRSCLAVLDDPKRVSEWPGALRALSRMHSMTVVYGLISRLKITEYASKRKRGISALAKLYHREGTWGGDSWGPRPSTKGPYFSSEPWGGSSTIANYLKTAQKDKRINDAFLVEEMSRNHIKIDNLLSVLTLLIDKPELEDDAIKMILERSEPPPEALPFLTFIASNPAHDGEMRIRAALGLAKSKDSMALDMALETAANEDKIEASYQAKEKLRKALFNNKTLENRYTSLIDHGFSPNPPLARFSWQILESWQRDDKRSATMRAEIDDAMDRAGKDPEVARYLPGN